MKSELEDFISNNRRSFDQLEPNPDVLDRIRRQMKPPQTAPAPEKRAIVIPVRWVQWAAAACLILIAGSTAFWMTQKKDLPATDQTASTVKLPVTAPPAPVTQPSTDATPASPSTAVADGETAIAAAMSGSRSSAIEEENRMYKQALFTKLNNMESPSQRVAAASQMYQMKSTDTDIVDALVKTMNTDPSTNVRLAALDALGKFYREPYVKKKLLGALDQQKDPMVQIGLIELLTKMKQRSILKELNRIVNDGNSMQAVKDQAYESMFQLDHKKM